MNLQRILIATDFSDSSRLALQYASNLAESSGAALHILHVDELPDVVVPPIAGLEGAYVYEVPEKSRQEIHDQLAQVVPTSSGVTYEQHYEIGSPADKILDFARQRAIELIVMGSHGRSGLSRLIMGSVAERVMRDAPCPVLIVKQHVDAPAPATEK
jgi:universal stress protein A